MNSFRTAEDIVRGLERHGLRFRSFKVASEGQWSSEDADWNYKDVPHLNQVHTMARTVPAAVGDEFIATVNVQRFAGFAAPISLANYVARDGSQVYFTTILWFVLVVKTVIIPIDSIGSHTTRVETTYQIGSPAALRWLFPLLRRVLASNYRVLMSEDLPMREQRGRLRSAGYNFASDGRQRTFSETVDLQRQNVLPPPPGGRGKVSLSGLVSDGDSVLFEDGPGGLRFVRAKDGRALVYDRVCLHEGACLDEARLAGESLVCPWHARRIQPLAVLPIAPDSDLQVQCGSRYLLTVRGEDCTVSPCEPL